MNSVLKKRQLIDSIVNLQRFISMSYNFFTVPMTSQLKKIRLVMESKGKRL